MEGLTGVDLAKVFAGRRVFVTGHTGFKGSWLAIWLHELGSEVHGYALEPPTRPSNFDASRVRELLASHDIGDIRDEEQLRRALSASRADVVLHLAAQPIVLDGYRSPRETLEVNVIGTAAVLDAVRASSRPCAVVVVTSDKCYANRETIWGYRESDRLGGHDPYSASKAAAELVAGAYRDSYFPPEELEQHGVQIATARAGNVIGGGDWGAHRLVRDIVCALEAGQAVEVYNPSAVRPWQHVLEPLHGYLLLAARMLTTPEVGWSQAWNFGPEPTEEVSVRELLELFLEGWGSGSWLDRRDVERPPETHRLRLSIERAMRQLDWRPRWDVREAIRRTAEWHRVFLERGAPDGGHSMRDHCLCDIDAYMGGKRAGCSRGLS